MPRGIPTSGKRVRRKPLKDKVSCTISDCTLDTISQGYCHKHYARLRRYGDPLGGKFERGVRNPSITGHGYVQHFVPDHPVAFKTGMLYVHRRVLYDHLGPGFHPCHWCAKPLEWGGVRADSLKVDHLDGDKQNNALGNLVPACQTCNGARGFFLSWAMKHRDDPMIAKLFADVADRLKARGDSI
jgi:hypothetical protein